MWHPGRMACTCSHPTHRSVGSRRKTCFSTVGRFRRKIDNIRAELAENAAAYHGDLAWHWKRWAAMTDAEIDREFTLQILEDDALTRLRESGVLRSAEEIFAERLVVDQRRDGRST